MTDTMIKTDLRDVAELVKVMHKEVEVMYDYYAKFITKEFHMSRPALEFALQFDIDEFKRDLTEYTTEEMQRYREFADKFKARDLDFLNPEAVSDEEIIRIMRGVKDVSVIIMSTAEEVTELTEKAKEFFGEQLESMSRKPLPRVGKEQIETLKLANELEEDEEKVRKNNRKIDALNGWLTFDFLEDRLKNVPDEPKKILDSLFNDRLSANTVANYNTTMKHIGFQDKIYSHFLNLEETFLPEEYHPFNNVFLYVYIRYASHINEHIHTEVMNVRTITSAIAKLFFHKFDTPEEEAEFLEFIKKILSYFEPYKEYCANKNINYKKNPERMKEDEEMEKAAVAMMKENLSKMGITDYDETLSSKELREFYNETVERWRKEQLQKQKQKETPTTKIQSVQRMEDTLDLLEANQTKKLEAAEDIVIENDPAPVLSDEIDVNDVVEIVEPSENDAE